jgi:hypothetical protein
MHLSDNPAARITANRVTPEKSQPVAGSGQGRQVVAGSNPHIGNGRFDTGNEQTPRGNQTHSVPGSRQTGINK